MESKRSFKIRMGTFILLLIFVSMFIGKEIYTKYERHKKLVDQRMYEIENSFMYVEHRGTAYAFFMIYEPPTDQRELRAIVEEYMTNNSYQERFYERLKPYGEYPVEVYIIKPSSEFKYGWKAVPGEDLITLGILHNRILHFSIQDSDTQKENWIYLDK